MFNQSPWEATQGTNAPMRQNHPHPRTRAMTNMNHHPSALFPAHRPSTVHSSDLFFSAPAPPPLPPPPRPPPPPPRPNRHNRPTTAPSGPHPPTYHHPQANHQPFYRSLTCPPPIPPKPSELLPTQQDSKPPPFTPPPPQLPAAPASSNEEDELALALALSRSESKKQQPDRKQEDEEFARALQESLKMAETKGAVHAPVLSPANQVRPANLSVVPPQEPQISKQPSAIASPSTPTQDNTRRPVESEGRSNINDRSRPDTSTGSTPIAQSFIDFDDGSAVDQCADDEALARKLADAEADTAPAVDACANDAVLARRLAEEEARASKSSDPPANNDVAQMRRNDSTGWASNQTRTSSALVGNSDNRRRAPLRGPETSLRGRSKSAMATLSVTPQPDPHDLPPPYEDSNATESTNVTPTSIAPVHSPNQPESSATTEYGGSPNYLPRTNSSPTVAGPQSPESTASFSSSSQRTDLVIRTTSLAPSSSILSDDPAYEDASSSSSSSISAVSNPYVSPDLLKGVSIGFDAPPMTSQLATWNKALPTMISLPFGRSLPLHLKTTSWRHLLKLLAGLPGTTIQATIEALAETKTEHRLRIVVQFVKTHLSSTEWGTILWLTLEHPVPANVTGSARYMNDVNILPWSYTLSTPPQLLRGGSDSQLTKTYTIPATNALAFPKLPITFPELAMYLHAALEVSRRHINDSSSGVRKLAKMVDTCYPNMNTDEVDDTERRGIGGLFKKVMGRTNRRHGGNEDTYDLVTPFVSEEWG